MNGLRGETQSKRLVVNADDLGLHPRIDDGIFRAHHEGIVTSATVLVTGRTAEAAVQTARETTRLGLGVHLCLTSGLQPAADPSRVRSVAPGGTFRSDWKAFAGAWLTGQISSSEVELEFNAQVELAQHLGVEIDHLDSHQHLHLLPGLRELVERLAGRLAVPLRWPAENPRPRWVAHPVRAAKSALLRTLGVARSPLARRVPAVGIFESGALDQHALLRVIRRLKPGVTELICHPGLAPGVISEDPDWRYDWEDELAALCSPKVRAELDRSEITLGRWSDFSA